MARMFSIVILSEDILPEMPELIGFRFGKGTTNMLFFR